MPVSACRRLPRNSYNEETVPLTLYSSEGLRKTMSQPNHDFLAPAEYGLLADFSPWPSPADFSVTLPVQNTGSSFIEGNHAAEYNTAIQMALPVYYSPYDSSQAATSPLNPVPTNSVATWQPQVERNSSQSTPVTPLRRLRVPQTIQASQNSRPFYSVEFQCGACLRLSRSSPIPPCHCLARLLKLGHIHTSAE